MASLPRIRCPAKAEGKWGRDQPTSSQAPITMRQRIWIALRAGLTPCSRSCAIWSCTSERISSRRAVRSCSGRASVYIHVQDRTRDVDAGNAHPRHNISLRVAVTAWSPTKVAVMTGQERTTPPSAPGLRSWCTASGAGGSARLQPWGPPMCCAGTPAVRVVPRPGRASRER